MLTKSRFIRYLQCPRYLWLSDHEKDALKQSSTLEQERMKEQGEEVETYARKLFAEGKHIHSFHEKGAQNTKNAIDQGVTVLYQATAIGDGLLAMADILVFNDQEGIWDIIEVKGSTEIKPEHLYDVCFQRLAFERAGYPIGTLSIAHINREYVREGDIDPTRLLLIEDVTEAAQNLKVEVEAHIPKAKRVMELTDVPSLTEFPCNCTYKNSPCPSHCFPNVPEHSIFEIRGLSMKKATALRQSGVETITNVPDDFSLSEIQQNQVLSAKRNEPIVDSQAIADALGSLAYPLYFFDYETFSSIVPPYDGFKPNVTMPFQYSLHVLESPESDVTHKEFLADERSNTIPAIVEALQKDIAYSGGTVITWNKSYERGCNGAMAELLPESADFLQAVNDRLFDLKDIFSLQHYVDYRFRGSYSLKKVLPVLVPHLSYNDLDVHEGMTASLLWNESFDMSITEREQIFKNLLEYCKLDTLAMVEIFRHLQQNS